MSDIRKFHVVMDLDNCISDDARRIALIDWDERDPDRRYKLYHEGAQFDAPRNKDVYHGAAIDLRAELIIITARPERHRLMTMEWLNEHFSFLPWLLLMRPEGDHRSSIELKPRLLVSLAPAGVTPNSVITCYDDHEGVVNAYKAAGYPAVVLKIHDVDAYNRPKAVLK